MPHLQPPYQSWEQGSKFEQFYLEELLKLKKIEQKSLSPYEKLINARWQVTASSEDETRFKKHLSRNQVDKDVIYLRDVKDVTLFNVLNDISPTFLHFFWTFSVDRFLRALIIYFQYFLYVWENIEYRADNKECYIRHKVLSKKREDYWRTTLNDLRYIVSRDYCSIIAGSDDSLYFHHLGPNCSKRSASRMDNLLYELLYRYSRRVVELVLELSNEDVIVQDEMNRLFRTCDTYIPSLRANFTADQRRCLEDPLKHRIAPMNTPVIQELYRSKRNPILYNIAVYPTRLVNSENRQINLLQMAYLCAESDLRVNNIRVGILGEIRNHFDTFLRRHKRSKHSVYLMKKVGIFNPRWEYCELFNSPTPPLKPYLPQQCDLKYLRLYDYNRKDEYFKWMPYTKVKDRLKSKALLVR